MKKHCVFFLCLLVSLACYSQKEFTINGNITNIADDRLITINRKSDANAEPVARDITNNGKFVLKGYTTEEAEPMVLATYRDGKPYFSREIWIGPGTTTINGDGHLADMWDVQNNTKEQQELNTYTEANKENIKQQLELMEAMVEIFGKITDPGEITEQMRIKGDSLRNLFMPINNRFVAKELEVMEKSSHISQVWLTKLHGYATIVGQYREFPFAGKVMELYARMSDTDKNTETGKMITAALAPPAEVTLKGKPAIDTDLKDLEGNTHRLADYYKGKGKYVLIDFWASWCGPCIMAMPEMREAAKKYKENLIVIGLNVDNTPDLWQEATNKHKIDWVNLREGKGFREEGLHTQYGCKGIPFYVLISPEGIVLEVKTGYMKGSLDKMLSGFIK